MSHASRALIILGYGQSNADAHVVGPRPASELLENPNVVTLSSGVGLRGEKYTQEGQRKGGFGVFTKEGVRLGANRIEDVMPATWCDTGSASILHAAGSIAAGDDRYRTIYVRTAARGGMRMVGLKAEDQRITGIFRLDDGSLSPLIEDLIATAGSFADHAVKDRMELGQLYILLIHGEADRSTDPDFYIASVREAKAHVDDALAARGLRAHWLFTQTGGTTHDYSGNDWHSRQMANRLMRLPDDNLTFLGPLYPYPLTDGIHHDAIGKTLIGELAGLAIREIEAGRPWTPIMPDSWRLEDERTIRIEVRSDSPLVLDSAGPEYDHFGFSLGHRIENRILSVSQADARALRVVLEQPPARKFALDYAFRRKMRDDPAIARPLPYGGGQVRSEWSAPSRIVPGAVLHHWMPGFRLEIPEGVTAGSFDAL